MAQDQLDAAALESWVRAFAGLVAENRELLTELDAAIGDADHGTNMDRGMKAVLAALDESRPTTPKALLTKVGMTLVSTVGGASGPLFGNFFPRRSMIAAPAGGNSGISQMVWRKFIRLPFQ